MTVQVQCAEDDAMPGNEAPANERQPDDDEGDGGSEPHEGCAIGDRRAGVQRSARRCANLPELNNAWHSLHPPCAIHAYPGPFGWQVWVDQISTEKSCGPCEDVAMPPTLYPMRSAPLLYLDEAPRRQTESGRRLRFGIGHASCPSWARPA
jgi:hypothetical protein